MTQSTCVVCYSDLEFLATMPCCGQVCQGCASKYVTARITSEWGVRQLRLGCASCNKEMDAETVQDLVRPPVFELYQTNHAHYTAGPRAHYCPFCNERIPLSADQMEQVAQTGFLLCFECAEYSCPDCGGPGIPHLGKGCELFLHTYATRAAPLIGTHIKLFDYYFPDLPNPYSQYYTVNVDARRAVDDLRNYSWKTSNTKKCRFCGFDIEKNGGCNHMRCTNCDFNFCWECEYDSSKYGLYSASQPCTHGIYRVEPHGARMQQHQPHVDEIDDDDDIHLHLFDLF